jgi:drug/metabolite transporter (DMT)-like permease
LHIKSNLSGEVIVLIMLLLMLDTFAQIFFKIGVTHLGEFPDGKIADILQYSIQLIINPFVISGVVALVFAFFTWLTLISKVDLSFAHPMTSLVYATIPLFSTWLLHESLHWQQAVGIALIVAGVFIVSEESPSQDQPI